MTSKTTYYSGNRYLTLDEMKVNATYIYNWFGSKGWTKNAICGMLGNIQRESTINPGLWQNFDEGNLSVGYGLVQWTPASNYTEWATANGYEWGALDSNCKRILYELNNGLQWIATSEYNLSFYEFTQSTESIEYLTYAFLKCYERAGVEAIEERISNSEYWYEYLTGEPSDPSEPITPNQSNSDDLIHLLLCGALNGW